MRENLELARSAKAKRSGPLHEYIEQLALTRFREAPATQKTPNAVAAHIHPEIRRQFGDDRITQSGVRKRIEKLIPADTSDFYASALPDKSDGR